MKNPEHRQAGYRQPPQHAQFKPGKSGNPSGRPKRIPSFQDALTAELAAAAAASTSNARAAISKQAALIRTLVDAAIAGNMRALGVLVPILMRIAQEENADQSAQLAPEDRELLEKYVDRELDRRAASQNPEAGDQQTGQKG